MVVRGDVVMALSASGETEEILRLLATLKRLQVSLISLTGDAVFEKAAGGSPATAQANEKISTLAAAADVALDCSVARKLAGSAWRLPLPLLRCSLWAMPGHDSSRETRLQEEDFANLHPGGKLGKVWHRWTVDAHRGRRAPRDAANPDAGRDL
jgi:arabinose-5-phosphate isomerase